MIMTLSGTNAYRIRAYLQESVAAFLTDHDSFALERIDAEETAYMKIAEALTSLPFLSDKKLIILRSASANSVFVERVETILTEVASTTDLILVEPKPDKRTRFYKYLLQSTDFRDCSELDQNSLVRWMIDLVSSRQGSISHADANYLLDRIGLDQLRIGNELEKLVLYNPVISRQTIDQLSEAEPHSTIFQLLEAAFAGDRRKTMRLYSEQRLLLVATPQIVAMLSWQLHILTLLKTAGSKSPDAIAKEAHLSPYVVKKSQSIAAKRSLGELTDLITDLLQIDQRSKREAIDSDEALQHYLLKLAS
jgi:DNA polymerase III delta subunit